MMINNVINDSEAEIEEQADDQRILVELPESESISKPEDDVVPLPAGESLSIEQAFYITAHEPSRFVVILGNYASGKTTLVTSLYQMFLSKCGVGEFLFAGSKTLTAFEARSFYTRTTSYAPQPDTPRTPNGARDVLHLRLYERERRREVNLLLSDFSGEEYNQVIGNPVMASEEFPQVREAKRIVVLVDGDKLTHTQSRRAEIQQSVHMLRTFYDGRLISAEAEIILAISKYDLLCALPGKDQARPGEMLKNTITNQFPELTGRISFLETAAMPDNEKYLMPYYGLDQLLAALLSESKQTEEEIPLLHTTSQFDLWGERTEE